MSTEILSISAKRIPNRGNSIFASYLRKKRGIKADQIGVAADFDNPKRVSVPRQGRIPLKKD